VSTIAIPGIFATSNIRRVRRDEVAKSAFQKPDPYVQMMACWLDYMRTDDRDLGIGGMKLASDAEPDVNVHDAQRAADLKVGEAVNAMVDSLAVLQCAAIYKSQGLSTAWRFASSNFEAVLLQAREDLEEKLKKNLATRIYFL
jgi:hypothetical protein